MEPNDAISAEREVRTALAFLTDALGGDCGVSFAVRLWDGTSWSPDPHATPLFTLVIRTPAALRRMFLAPSQLSLGEAYIFGDYDVEGEMEAAFALADCLLDRPWGIGRKLRSLIRLLRLPGEGRAEGKEARLKGWRHSRERDRQAVGFHYNVSNDFYHLWLDRRMVYSCAYFADPGEELEHAQERKLDHVCRKLRLRPGERLLDIGCGWGALIIHAAERYGVEAVGVTISTRQAELARQRIREAGLEGRCRVEVADYRELREIGGFHKLVSIGMVEHVGRARLGDYFNTAWRLLRPGGVFLNHGIVESLTTPPSRGPSFIDRYVFPDGELVSVSEMVRFAEASGFEARDLENLREHYAITLRHWVRRLGQAWDEAVGITGEVTPRIWRLFMAGSAHGFETGRMSVCQLLLSKPERGKSGFPLTRGYMYPP